MIDVTKVKDIKVGLRVLINTRDGDYEGVISKILSSIDNAKGIKVQLESGEKGRIIKVLGLKEVNKPQIKDEVVYLNDVEPKGEESVVIDIDNSDIKHKENLFSNTFNQINYMVTTKFFQSTYCRAIKSDIQGIVIFKVKAAEVSIAIYKINLYLKKFCLTKDLKYEVIKVEN